MPESGSKKQKHRRCLSPKLEQDEITNSSSDSSYNESDPEIYNRKRRTVSSDSPGLAGTSMDSSSGSNIERENNTRVIRDDSFTWTENDKKRITFAAGGYSLTFDPVGINKDNEVNSLIIDTLINNLKRNVTTNKKDCISL
jgi:hypothetical protein